jgi:hypothetical protein
MYFCDFLHVCNSRAKNSLQGLQSLDFVALNSAEIILLNVFLWFGVQYNTLQYETYFAGGHGTEVVNFRMNFRILSLKNVAPVKQYVHTGYNISHMQGRKIAAIFPCGGLTQIST